MPAVVTSCPRPRSSLAISRSVAGSSSTTRMRSDDGRVGSASAGAAGRLAVALDRRLGQRLQHDPERRPPVLARRSRRRACPPWASTMPLQIARPSPSPPNLRVIVVSPCWKGSKIRGRTSGSMPMPVSADLDDQAVLAVGRPRCGCGSVIVPPSGVNLTAFLIRFQKTCWSRAGSALTWRCAAARSSVEPQVACRGPRCGRSATAWPIEPVAVGDLPVQRHLAPDDPHHVQQVVDQPGLEVDVLADHLQRRADLLGLGGPSSIAEAASRIGFSGVRSSWREHGEELGLRPVGRLGLLLGRPQLLLVPPPLGDVPEVDREAVRGRVGVDLVPAVVRRVERLERDGRPPRSIARR